MSVQLFSMKGNHFSTCFLFPIMHYCDRIVSSCTVTVDEKEDKKDIKNPVIGANKLVCEPPKGSGDKSEGS